jgi:adenosine deaminase
MLEKEFLNRKKIDLHCHLDGSLVLKSMSEILGREVRKEA